jgi:ATP-dependent RNA circularization protein (DNA/RNA ligase family)
MKFKEYVHIERFGVDEVEGIELGEIVVFYKIDGTNGSVWLDEGSVRAGSRRRELSLEADNRGFLAHVLSSPCYSDYLFDHQDHRLYGEWLVPHTLKTYRQDAWNKFYVFDVAKELPGGSEEFLPYDVYQESLEAYGIEYIPPIARYRSNTNYESLVGLLGRTGEFLVSGGEGEGIVIKNYGFHNKYGRQVWAKIVSSEFKEKNIKLMGCPELKAKDFIEQKIIDKFCTDAFIKKEYEKIKTENNGWQSKHIPMLLGRVFHELIKEESWNFVKEYKYPTINFKTLNNLAIQKVKSSLPEVF